MTTQQQLKQFKEAVKLIALYQATLEQMDVLKSTSLYKHKIKRQMKNLEQMIEQHIRGPLTSLDQTDEELMSTVQYNIEAILDLSLEELASLKLAVDEHRDGELNK